MSRREASTRLDDGRVTGPIDPPPEASPRDKQSIRRVNRNVQIRRRYPTLRDEHGWERACEILSDEFPSVSKWTVREIINERR